MGLLSNLFKKGEAPLFRFIDPILGAMRWSEDDGKWLGEYKHKTFGLAYEGKTTPASDLIAYAHDLLDDEGWQDATLAKAKEEAQKEYPETLVRS